MRLNGGKEGWRLSKRFRGDLESLEQNILEIGWMVQSNVTKIVLVTLQDQLNKSPSHVNSVLLKHTKSSSMGFCRILPEVLQQIVLVTSTFQPKFWAGYSTLLGSHTQQRQWLIVYRWYSHQDLNVQWRKSVNSAFDIISDALCNLEDGRSVTEC